MFGSAGISGFDAFQLQGLLLRHGKHSEKLRSSFVKAITRQANQIIAWEEICALKAKRLIALNKLPGVRPIGIGEAPDRCFEKVMSIVTGEDVMDACGADQLCSGVKSGIEGAVHAIDQTFMQNCDDGWGLLLSDGDNAFNSMSRVVFLWNARILWPRCSIFLFNSYQGFAVLVLRGSETHYLLSKEGCTQGSGLAMQAYAIGNLPLIKNLKNPSKWIQNWFADDGSSLGKLDFLKDWLELLNEEGPKYGYYNQVSKNVLIVAPKFVEKATAIFGDFGVQIVTGQRVLGGFIGSDLDKKAWLEQKISFWSQAIKKISDIAAKKDPQAAFIAVSKSLQNEWSYIQRVVNTNDEAFLSLKDAICTNFLPQICGFAVNNLEADVLLRPARYGGIGIRDPVKSAASSYQTSLEASFVLRNSILLGSSIDIHAHNEHSKKAAQIAKQNQEEMYSLELDEIIQSIPCEHMD